MADEVAGAAELVMGKAAGDPGRDRPRPRRRRGSATARSTSSSAPPPRRPVPVSGRARPRSSRRGGRSGRSPTSRSTRDVLDALVEAACIAPGAAPLAAVAVRRRRHRPRRRRRSPTGMGERWRADLAADGVDAGARRRAGRRVAPQAHGRARARARLPHLGRARPLPRRGAPAGRVGHGAAVARRRGREPHARRGRGTGSRRAGSRRRSSAPRPRATRSRSPTSGSRTRWCSLGHPDPAYVGRRPPADPARRAPRSSARPASDVSGRRWARNHSSVRPTPSSRSVHGFQPRWISARPGSSDERCELARPGRRVVRRRPVNPIARAIDVVELLHARLDAGADVDDEPAALVRRAHERVDDVVDEHEVAGLLAVAEDRGPRAVEHHAGEDRDDAGFAVRVLARAVDVRERRARCTRARGSPGSSGGSRRPPSSRRRTATPAAAGALRGPAGARACRRACRPTRRTRPSACPRRARPGRRSACRGC